MTARIKSESKYDCPNLRECRIKSESKYDSCKTDMFIDSGRPTVMRRAKSPRVQM